MQVVSVDRHRGSSRGPATGTVHDGIGLVSRVVGNADAGHTIAGHDEIYDPGAADDFRAMAKPRGGQHGMCVDHQSSQPSSGKNATGASPIVAGLTSGSNS